MLDSSYLKKIRLTALNMLARRELCTQELLRKLQNKPFDIANIQYVVTALINEGLVNDERYAENFIHYRRNKGYGPIRIRLELVEKGIKEHIIDQYLNMSDQSWLIDAKNAWQKRFKNTLPKDLKMRSQQVRFLLYRGFTSRQIEFIFKE